jgi:hypothetical protein
VKNNALIITGSDQNGYYISKYSLSGTLQTKTSLFALQRGIFKTQIRGIAADTSGNYYIAGVYKDTITFGGQSLYNNTDNSYLFVAKFLANGTQDWIRSASGGHVFLHTNITVDISGNVYVSGDYTGSFSISTATFTCDGFTNGFIVKFDQSGTYQWTYNLEGKKQVFVNSLAADTAKNLYALGYYDTPLSIGSSTLSIDAPYTGNVFLIKINPNGAGSWARKIGGGYTDLPGSVCVDDAGGVYLSSYYRTAAQISTVTLTSANESSGATEPFVAKYNSSGNFQWVLKATCGTDGQAMATDLIRNYNAKLYLTGAFFGEISFGATSRNYDSVYMFLTKITE